MSEVRCTRPGCNGIIEDGYCNVDGLAPDPPARPPGRPSPPTGWTPGPGGANIRFAGASPAIPPPGSVGSGGSGSGGSGSGGSASGGSASGGTGSTGSGSAGTSSWSSSVGTGSQAGTRGSRSTSGRSSRGQLGAGLVNVPSVPALDPAAAVLRDPQVPENRRFCSNCGHQVGRSRDGRPGRTDGFCPECQTRYSFSPKLVPGEMVAGQYEVVGCLAHGGLGWIYLARDHNLNRKWVVLKGLLNTGDADAMAAAEAEKQFLVQLDHPNIVRIYNFVQHASRGEAAAGYIVMDYLGGKSLKQLRLDARQRGEAVPLAHALAYALEILPAFGYLHDRGLVYCDFKPDNIIQSEEQLKLIDLGGVRYISDEGGAIYGTVGYQAPEIETEGPSPSSDLYTVGRTLAVLTFEFPDFQQRHRFTLPEDQPLLAQRPSYARLLLRATHREPGRRFQTAGEMAEQLTGVLREVLSVEDGQPRPAFSGLFSPELRAIGTDLAPAAVDGKGALAVPAPASAEVIAGLPAPLIDGSDPAVGYLATLAGLAPAAQAQALGGAVAGDAGVPPEVAGSPETRLALVRALIAAGDPAAARAALAELAPGQADWRATWYGGLCALASGRPDQARAAFGAVYDELPGELAPKLALGFAAEAAGDTAAARYYFGLVWTIDRSYVSAGFGTARACLAGGDRVAAIAAIAAVPETSSHFAAAQIAAVRLLVAGGTGRSEDDLRQADFRLGRLSLDDNDPRRHQLGVEILRAALDWVSVAPTAGRNGAAQAAGQLILGCEPNERALRFGLERGYRALANLVPERRVELVDMANSVRPKTWI